MTDYRLRTSRRAQAAVVGLGVASALGTAAGIAVTTLQPAASEDAGTTPATTSTQRTVVVRQATRGDEGEREEGFTKVRAPRKVRVVQQGAARGTTTQPAPQATSSGS
jgi:hypothetical protein